MLYIKLHVMDAVPSMLAKPADMLPLEFQSIKRSIPLFGQHLVECCGTTHNVKWEILDACRGVEKPMTIEAIYIKKLKPQLNTRDGYRGRELTLKY